MMIKPGQRYLRSQQRGFLIVEVFSEIANSNGEYDCVVVQSFNDDFYCVGQNKSCDLLNPPRNVKYEYLEGQDKP